jgi:hypothetical protein
MNCEAISFPRPFHIRDFYSRIHFLHVGFALYFGESIHPIQTQIDPDTCRTIVRENILTESGNKLDWILREVLNMYGLLKIICRRPL